MSTVRAVPPLELSLDELGRRCVPLQSLRRVLEWQLHVAPEEASLEKLLEAVGAAEEAPLPGLTPQRAWEEIVEVPLDFVRPREERDGTLLHPAAELGATCSNCGGEVHTGWCPVGTGPVDPLQR